MHRPSSPFGLAWPGVALGENGVSAHPTPAGCSGGCTSLQDIVSALEDRLRPLVQAELSVLVDVLHRPELLFPENTDARRKCESGGFICK